MMHDRRKLPGSRDPCERFEQLEREDEDEILETSDPRDSFEGCGLNSLSAIARIKIEALSM